LFTGLEVGYEEPGYDIKQLLGRQRELEKKRNQEKGEYFFQIKFEISVRPQFAADAELKRAKTLLDKKSFAMWHEEKTLSINNILAVDESNGDRFFTHRNAPLSQRIVPSGSRCNYPLRVKHPMQCCHEIAENGGKLNTDLVDSIQ